MQDSEVRAYHVTSNSAEVSTHCGDDHRPANQALACCECCRPVEREQRILHSVTSILAGRKKKLGGEVKRRVRGGRRVKGCTDRRLQAGRGKRDVAYGPK